MSKEKRKHLNRASSSKSFLLVIPMSKTLFKASTPSICKVTNLSAIDYIDKIPTVRKVESFPRNRYYYKTKIYKISQTQKLKPFTYLCKQLIHNTVMNSSTIPG